MVKHRTQLSLWCTLSRQTEAYIKIYINRRGVIRVSDIKWGRKSGQNRLNYWFDLEKTLQVVNLEYRIGRNHQDLEYRPPFYPRIGRFSRISVGSFSDDKISLLGLNIVGQLAHSLNRVVQWVGFRIVNVNIDNPVNIEGHIQVDTTSFFVRETVLVLTGGLGLYLLVPVIQVLSLQNHLTIRGCDLDIVSITTLIAVK